MKYGRPSTMPPVQAKRELRKMLKASLSGALLKKPKGGK